MLIATTWLSLSLLTTAPPTSEVPLQRPTDPIAESEPTPARPDPLTLAAPQSEVPSPSSPAVSDPPTLPEPGPGVSDLEPPPEAAQPVVAEEPPQVATPPPAIPADPFSEEEQNPLGADGVPPGYVRVERPRGNGQGLMWAAITAFSFGTMFQIGDLVVCGNCAVGGIERAFFAVTLSTATAAGFRRGRQDAYQDAARQQGMRDGRRALVSGAVLLGVGAVAGLVNEGMWWRCIRNGDGPLATTDGNDIWSSGPSCRYGVSRAVLDLSVMSASAGGALLGWAIQYRKDAASYRRARVVSVAPQVTKDFAGLQVGGRF